MKRRILLALLAIAAVAHAQRTLAMDASVVKQTRIDLRDLGYSPVDVIPADESAIRALALAPNGALYGATSGTRSHLFVLYPQHGYVQPLGVLPGMTTVHRSLVISAENDVYIGGSIAVDNNGAGFEKYEGGHLLRYAHRNDEATPIKIGSPLKVEDLGIPVPGEAIYSLAIDRANRVIYGLSYPGGQFFRYSIADGKFTVVGPVAKTRIPGERFENEKAIGRAIAIDREGNVFTSGDAGHFYRFGFKSQRLEQLDARVPTVRGREVYNRVDAWAVADEGALYGGGSDGYLFRLDPKTFRVENLGKPLNQARIRGLAFVPGGKLYGVGGNDDEMARLFSYAPARGTYEMLGMIDVNRRPYYSWQAYVIDAMAADADGTLYMGQAERKSKLYIYCPE
jgi:hypothetical protein